MARTEIEVVRRMLDQAYRTDPWSALRKNIESVRLEEWDVRPRRGAARSSAPTRNSICDVAIHRARSNVRRSSVRRQSLEWA